MRVLLLTPSVRPLGARRSLVELAKALPRSVDLHVICPSNDGIALELKELGVGVTIIKHGAWRKLGGRLRATFSQVPALRRFARDWKPTIAHANEFHIVPNGDAGLRTLCPLTGHVRLTITRRQIRTYGMARCSRVVAVSRAVQGLFDGSGLESKVRVVYNGVDVTSLSPHGPILSGLPKEWEGSVASGNPPESPLRVGLFGLISDRKQQLVAVEAVARARKAGANVLLLIAGDAFKATEDYGQALDERIRSEELQGSVIRVPFTKDVGALYRSIDLNLLISSEEGFGRTIIEAGAMNIPSIGSNVGGIPELIDPGITGELVKLGDVEALSHHFVRLFSDRAKLREMGSAAKDRIEKHFTIQAHVRAMLGIWEEAIAEWRP